MVRKIHILVMIFLLSFNGCTKIMTTNSKPFLDVQRGLTESTEALNFVAKKLDALADLQKEISLKVGLGSEQYDNQKRVSSDTKELLAIIKHNEEEAKKDREANAQVIKTLLAFAEKVAPVAGQALGVPAPATSAAIDTTKAILGTGLALFGGKMGSDFVWNRRRKKDEEEWEKHCEDLEKEHEEDKAELKKSLLIKQRRDGKLPPEHFEEKAEATRLAIEELTKEGKI